MPFLKYRLEKADWPKFSQLVKSKLFLLPEITHAYFLSLYDDYIEALTTAAKESIPIINCARNKISSPTLWDSEYTKVIKNRTEVELIHAKDLSLINFLVFQKVSASLKRILNQKKRKR